MSTKDPVLTMAGKVPCIGRTDVGYDYRVGRAAAEHGDAATSRRLARSLGRFAVQHIGYMLAQTSFVHTQTTLSRKLHEKSDVVEEKAALLGAPSPARPDIVTPSSLVEIKPFTAPERPAPPVRDRIFTAVTQGAFGLAALHGAVELASAVSEQF